MVVKLFILGLPGSGKSTISRHIVEHVRRQPADSSAIRISDYDILDEMFQADVECKQFRPTEEHQGFDVLDLSVFDTALKQLEEKVQDLNPTGDALIIIEFARVDYNEALRQFIPKFLEDAYFLFVDADIDICKQRIRERTAHPTAPDDHFVSEYIFDVYYQKDDRQYMSSNIKTDHGIDDHKIRIIDNAGSQQDFIEPVNQFIELVLQQNSNNSHP